MFPLHSTLHDIIHFYFSGLYQWHCHACWMWLHELASYNDSDERLPGGTGGVAGGGGVWGGGVFGVGDTFPIFFLIQSTNADTLAYTPYLSFAAQPSPQLVTPCRKNLFAQWRTVTPLLKPRTLTNLLYTKWNIMLLLSELTRKNKFPCSESSEVTERSSF